MDFKNILINNNFKFNRQFGQNFITDTNLLNAIVKDSGITSEDCVLEIGSGAGALTLAISAVAKKVVTFEIDNNLKPVLAQTLAQTTNVNCQFADIQKITDQQIVELTGENFCVIANLPYYITTPIIMRFLEGSAKAKSITVMVQNEVAQRLCASAGTESYGAITANIGLYANVEFKRKVTKNLFYPVPNVDSAIIKITANNKFENVLNKLEISHFVKMAFFARRKILANNIEKMFGIEKPKVITALKVLNIDENARAETLTTESFCKLYSLLFAK